MHEAYVFDRAASELADSGLDVVRKLANRRLERLGKRVLARRFSPGYGDVELSVQKLLFDRLKLSALGVSILPSYMLVPEKSVIALSGIRRVNG